MNFRRSRRFCIPLVALLTLVSAWSASFSVRAAELLVADQAGNRVIAVDETTGKFLRVVASTGLDLPSSLSWGPGGFLYASNFGAYAGPGSAASIVKIDPVSGVVTPFITTIAGPGAVAYDAVHHPNAPLFVSKLAEFVIVEGVPMADFSGSEVFQFDAAGALVNTIGTGSPGTGRSGIAFDDEGDLYVSEFKFFEAGNVLKYDAQDSFASLGTYASGAGVTITAPPGSIIAMPAAGGLNGLAFDAEGGLYAAALTGVSVVKFTDEGGTVTGAQADGPMAYPSGLLVESSGNVVITSLGNNNGSDPYYPGNVFPGALLRYHPDTNAVTPVLVGDANRDNVVDGDDLAVIAASYGVDAGGDFDGDADTDGEDFLLWQRALGNQMATGSFLPTGIVRYEPIIVEAATAPEPAAAGLAVAATMGASFASRRRR